MGRFRNEDDTIRVDNSPEDYGLDEKRQMLEFLKTKGLSGIVQFEDANNALQGQVADTAKLTDQDALEADQAKFEAENPETTIKGVIDSFAREIGPTAVAAAIGLPVAAAERLTSYITPGIADFINEKLNLEGTKWEQMNSQEMYDYIHDKLGLEKPDTAAEKIAATGGKAGAETLGAVGTGQLLGTAGQLMQGATPLQGVNPAYLGATNPANFSQNLQAGGELLSSKAGTQVVGGIGSGVGAESGSQAAEAMELGPIASTLMTLGGAIVGDLSATKLADMSNAVADLMQARGMSLPEATQEIINQAKARGVDVLLSDFKPKRIDAEDRRTIREIMSGGTRRTRFDVQAPQRETLVKNIASEFDVDIDNPNVSQNLENVAQDFFSKREAELTNFTNAKNEVIQTLSESGDSVPTPTANALIEEKIADLQRIDNPQNNPIEKALESWKTRFSDLPDNEADKTLETIEDLRRDLSQAFTGIEGGPRDRGQKIADDLYLALRKDMNEYIKAADPTGAQFAKFDDSMSGLSNLMEDFSTEGISSLMNNKDTPISAIESIIINGKPDVIRRVYSKLTPEGQNSARSAMIAKMIEDSTSGANLSPNKFANKIKQYSGQNGVLFSQEDGVHLPAIKKILDRTSRAERDALGRDIIPGEGIPGVTRLVTGMVARNPITAIPTMLATKATGSWLLRHMEDPPLRDLLLKYDALPNRARSGLAGDELLKRMSEMVVGYTKAEESANQAPATTRESTQAQLTE